MIQNILTVTRTKMQATQNLNQVRMHIMDTHIKNSLFADFTNAVIHLFACLINHFFNAGRMNSAILNELLQRDSRDFPSNRIKSAQNNGLRGIVNN